MACQSFHTHCSGAPIQRSMAVPRSKGNTFQPSVLKRRIVSVQQAVAIKEIEASPLKTAELLELEWSNAPFLPARLEKLVEVRHRFVQAHAEDGRELTRDAEPVVMSLPCDIHDFPGMEGKPHSLEDQRPTVVA